MSAAFVRLCTCRVCSSDMSPKRLSSLFSRKGLKEDLLVRLSRLLLVPTEDGDGLPQYVCKPSNSSVHLTPRLSLTHASAPEGPQMPTSTSSMMATILARQFVKLQAPPHLESKRTKDKASVYTLCLGCLAVTPARDFVCDLLQGIEFGFRIRLHSLPPLLPPKPLGEQQLPLSSQTWRSD